MNNVKRALFFFCLLVFSMGPQNDAGAVEPDEMLDNPVLEARAREISRYLRCLVCQNQTIDDSSADLAKDLRKLVRERLVAGDTNDEVMQYIVDRYGDFVLLKPPMQSNTLILWFGPAAILIVGLLMVMAFYRRSRRNFSRGTPDLTEQEQRQLRDILDNRPQQ